jgi:D-lactate dehydrogenase
MLPSPYKEFKTELSAFIPKARIHTDPLRLLAYRTDASVYRLTPKLVVDVLDEAEVMELLGLAHRLQVPVTFRAAGTSLSGQAVTDSVLVRIGKGWRNWRVGEKAEKITLQPGIIGSGANKIMAEFGKKIGPDPASIDSCFIGGIFANNASGMCCGTADNSYKTVLSTRMILADGALLDTADAKSRAAFARSHGHILAGLAALREKTLADQALAERIRRKFKIKNTTGYSLNALVDFEDPFEILQHVMVGSEGTLGFIAEVTYRTVEEAPFKASALLLLPTVKDACDLASAVARLPVASAELMDRASLRSVEGTPGLPEGLETLDDQVCSLLVETRAPNQEGLNANIAAINEAFKDVHFVRPYAFTDKPEEYGKLWRIRKGILASVGGMRPVGTSIVIEDVAFTLDRLGEAATDLQALFARHGYSVAPLFGHARDGNLHFVFWQDFGAPAEVARYKAFMDDFSKLITEKYDGSLKAEHGTGRNVAPFVELEWGSTAYAIMKEIKNLLDPQGILNPGVLLNEDPQGHVKNLKPLTPADPLADKCMECGFCESVCPSRELTLTPRQRIAAYREICRLRAAEPKSPALKPLEKAYEYMGKATCATDSLCRPRCPAGVDTGVFIKSLRHKDAGACANKLANGIADHFAGTCRAMSFMLNSADGLHRLLGTTVMQNGARLLRCLSCKKIPLWNKDMPKGGRKLHLPAVPSPNPKKVVYFPSCIARNMGPGAEHADRRSEPEAVVSVLLKGGYDVILPKDMEKLCCGMAFASKGLTDAARKKEKELEAALKAASNNGEYPVLCETSPCLLHMKETLDPAIRFYEPVEFIMDNLMDALPLQKLPKTVALHATCSMRKMGLEGKLEALARKCAENVVVPEGIDCCGWAGDRGFTHPELNESALKSLRMQVSACEAGYSSSRTCQIGLSLHSGIPYYSIVFLVDEASK